LHFIEGAGHKAHTDQPDHIDKMVIDVLRYSGGTMAGTARTSTVFVAGATGIVGRLLVPGLVSAGYVVHGITRSAGKVAALETMGAAGHVVDVYDADRLREIIVRVKPDAIIHQLTDLPPELDPARMPEYQGRNARIRIEGSRNLVAAAEAAGARRIVAQSIAWVYAPGPEPHGEEDPLDHGAEGQRGATVAAVDALEKAVLGCRGAEGIVLRYGAFYGPGTGRDQPGTQAPLSVPDAAKAAVLALEKGPSGIYNVAENEGYVSTARIRAAMGWKPGA
jgi:nucleoside-diphosphate-sugar epimerase